MGTSPQQVERLEKGQRSLRPEWIDKAASAFGVTPAEIISDAADTQVLNIARAPDHAPVRNASIDDGTVEITALDLTLSMGPGTHIDDWVESEPVKFDIGFLRAITRSPFNRLRLVRGIGDSMYPTLNGGDAIMIDTTQNSLSRQDGIYWISLHGAAGIKRLRTIARDRVLVVSDNPGVDNQEVAAEDLRIEGRAIWFARDL